MVITKPPVLPAWAESGDKVTPSNAEIQVGWPLSSIPPSRQRFNWLLNFLANGIRYFSRRGLPDYDAAETYMTGDRIIGDDGKTYRSLIDNNTAQTPSTSPTKWERWALTLAEMYTSLTTPAQFDNSVKPATTAFVRQAGIQTNGISAIDGNVTLTAADVGKSLVVQGAGGYNVTLPDVSLVPAGARIEIFGGAAATLLPAGGQVFYSGYATGVTVPSLALKASDSLTLVAVPGASTPGWFIEGELQLQYSSQFAQSKGANGYYKTPGGIIRNYGIATTSGSSDVTVTFPLAFPNACRSITATYVNGTTSGNTTVSIGAYGLTNFGLGAWNAATGTRGAVSVFWEAVGY